MRKEKHLPCDFQNRNPIRYRRHRYPQGCGQVGLIENLSDSAGKKGEEAAKKSEVTDRGNCPHIPLQIGLEVRPKPSMGTRGIRQKNVVGLGKQMAKQGRLPCPARSSQYQGRKLPSSSLNLSRQKSGQITQVNILPNWRGGDSVSLKLVVKIESQHP